MFGIRVYGQPTPGQARFTHKSRVTGRTVEFYAERGMISIHGELPAAACGVNQEGSGEDFKRCSRTEFYARTAALNGEARRLLDIANRDNTRNRRYRQEARDLQALVQCMIQAIRACDAQGDPFAPGVMRDVARDNRRIASTGHTFETAVPPEPRAPAGRPPVDIRPDAMPRILIARR